MGSDSLYYKNLQVTGCHEGEKARDREGRVKWFSCVEVAC